jgi:hypothetical protein
MKESKKQIPVESNGYLGSQSTFIPRVSQCLSPRPNWDPPTPLTQTSVSNGGGHTRQPARGLGSQFGRQEKKPITLSTLCLGYWELNVEYGVL